MNELRGNLWDYHAQGAWVVITTNGSIRKDGACVMGRGVALQAARLFPDLPFRLGDQIAVNGNIVHAFSGRRIFTFPVKERWIDKADLNLIRASAARLVRLIDQLGLAQVYTVRPGCGNGGLTWDVVKPVLNTYYDERFYVVEQRD